MKRISYFILFKDLKNKTRNTSYLALICTNQNFKQGRPKVIFWIVQAATKFLFKKYLNNIK